MGDGDPEHLTVGVETNCCQRIGGVGESAAIDALRNPKAGTLVLGTSGGEILAQSYFHYTGKGYILDNVEWNEGNVRKSGTDINLAYYKLATWAKDNLGIEYFSCGERFNKLDNELFGKMSFEKDPREFSEEGGYTDWDIGESLDLTKYKGDLGKPAKREKEEEVGWLSYPHIEDMGRIKSKKFHGELGRRFNKKKDKEEEKRRKERRRALEGLVEDARALAIPAVREEAEKVLDGRSTEEELRAVMRKYKAAEVAIYLLKKYGY